MDLLHEDAGAIILHFMFGKLRVTECFRVSHTGSHAYRLICFEKESCAETKVRQCSGTSSASLEPVQSQSIGNTSSAYFS